MADRTCENCHWWKDAKLTAQMQDIETDRDGYVTANAKALGYCEPETTLGDDSVRIRHCGLTAEDYSCGEWLEATVDVTHRGSVS